MTSAYRAPLEEYRFLFEEVLGFSGLASVPGFAEATPDVVESILCEGAALAEEVVQPLNAPADRTGCPHPPLAQIAAAALVVEATDEDVAELVSDQAAFVVVARGPDAHVDLTLDRERLVGGLP